MLSKCDLPKGHGFSSEPLAPLPVTEALGPRKVCSLEDSRSRPFGQRRILTSEMPAYQLLLYLCRRGPAPDGRTGADPAVLVSLVCDHGSCTVPGLEGFAPRFLVAAVASFPDLSATHLSELLSVVGTVSHTCAGDADVVRKVLAHPSRTFGHVRRILSEQLDKLSYSYLRELVSECGPVEAKLAELYWNHSFVPGYFPRADLTRIGALLEEGGLPLLEVYVTLRSDMGVRGGDLARVVELLELALLAL